MRLEVNQSLIENRRHLVGGMREQETAIKWRKDCLICRHKTPIEIHDGGKRHNTKLQFRLTRIAAMHNFSCLAEVLKQF
jgi:hypothetical protein